ncbi:MAG: autoinducer 2 ABC transporter substrate-binding protein [Spirochaetales bacterium]|nr:autoinducer 2 ABC transporter substrate-binding protein [Spirochaetales bacterium]MCF7936998.1 autoinducer 2 ABC transporter substrate-binding protein [Spirochaetales bacterium]
MKKGLLILFMVLAVSALVFAGGQQEGEKAAEESGEEQFEIAMVVKLEGVAWFDNMRLGIQDFNSDFDDVNAYQIGADTADPAAQVALVEDLIAKGVDAILVVPNDPESLVPAFKKANNAGILTFTHEASVQRQVSYDVEAFDNTAYGRHMMDVMADWMDEEGVWQPFVGHLTSTTHNEWVDGEIAQAQEKYPNLKQATNRIEEKENQQIAYEKALELLKTYPDIEAMMGSAMSTVPGVAQAIEEKGRIGKVAAFGTCLPSVAGDYLESGAAKSIHFWVPADAGYVTAHAAYLSLKGEEIKEGMDLGKPGYESITIQKNDSGVPVIYGQAWVDVNKDNLDEWKDADGNYKL